MHTTQSDTCDGHGLGRRLRIIASALLAALIAACGGGGSGGGVSPPPVATGVAPTFTAQPQGQTVAAPATASFTVVADGSPSPTLQWQVSADGGSTWQNIGGATAASYSTAATVQGDSGQQFRVVASNSVATVDSNAALLTVTTVPAAAVRYFSGNDGGATGAELWKTDGTPAGTVLVKDINPGPANSSPGGFTEFNGAVYFAAFDGVEGRVLWKTDGTAAGTMAVAPGAGVGSPGFFTPFNNALYFQANDGIHGAELWKTDGTAAGTVMVMDINPVPTSGSSPAFFTVFNGALYFQADDGTHGRELWKTDGTAAGTVMVADINPAGGNSFPSSLTVFNGALYFQASDGVNGSELWKTDGTAAGTVMIELVPGPLGSAPSQLIVFGGALYFQASNGVDGTELWRSDGTRFGLDDDQGHLQRAEQQQHRRVHRLQRRPLLPGQRLHARRRALEDRWQQRRHRAGCGHQHESGTCRQLAAEPHRPRRRAVLPGR